MAGHSKWANIKHRKAAQDAKRGKVFTKLIREITVSAKMGGGIIEDNPRLRTAVDKALSANMTRDTIDRAIKRGAGGEDQDNLEEVTYEGYGPNGVAVLVKTLTDNRNRTVAEVRHAFTKSGGNLGTDGSVSYLFTKQGEMYFTGDLDQDALMESAIEAGADDVLVESSGVLVITDPNELNTVKDQIIASGFTPESADIAMSPSTEVDLDEETSEKVLKLLDKLEDLDDVQSVFSNANIDEATMEKLMG